MLRRSAYEAAGDRPTTLPRLNRRRARVILCLLAAPLLFTAFARAGQSTSRTDTKVATATRQERDDDKRAANPQLASATSHNAVKVNVANRIELHVDELPIADVLRMLSAESRRNIIASKEVAGTVTANLYDVTLEQALDAVLRTNNLGFVKQGEFIYVHTRAELDALRSGDNALVTRVIRLKYLGAADAKGMLDPLLTKNGRISVTPSAAKTGGGSTGSSSSGSSSSGSSGSGSTGSGGGSASLTGDEHVSVDMIIVTDTAENLRNIEKVLADLDIRPRQVLVEATILRATLNEDNALGIDFTTVGGVDFAMVGSTSNPADRNLVTGALPTAKLNDTTFSTSTDFAAGVPRGGLTFGIIKNNIGVFVRALEQVTDTNVIANPKVLSLNKQLGEVIVGRRDGYLTTTVTETSAIQTVEFLETGTQLFFRPYIMDDQYVRMEIHPEDSTGGLTAANLPFKQTTEVTTNILVRDGHTILIGGLFREVTSAARGQIPLLGNIPGVGMLFRNTNDNTTREEVIILLTVHIVKGEIEERDGDRLSDDVERARLGSRRGLQAWGRERLAQAHYRWALEHLARGEIGQATWDSRMALHHAPSMSAAMHLLEELQQRRLWDEDGSAVRNDVQRLIGQEHGVETAPFGRPAPPFNLPDGFKGAPGFEPEPQENRKPETKK